MLVDHTMASVTQTASSAVYASAMWESMWERRGCCGLVQGHLFCETARSRGRWDESCVRRPCLWLVQGQAARAGRWPPRRRARLSVRGAFGEDLFERIELETDRRERISRKLDAAYSTSFPLLFLTLLVHPSPPSLFPECAQRRTDTSSFLYFSFDPLCRLWICVRTTSINISKIAKGK